ncbi:MAG: acyl carrier protein [Chthoniobacterales bacterium]
MALLPETMNLESELLALISERLLKIPPDFGFEDSLPDIGFDSMTVMQLLILVEEKYGITLNDEDLSSENFKSVAALANLLRSVTK